MMWLEAEQCTCPLGAQMDISTETDQVDSARGTRRIRTLAEKLQILKETTEPGASVASVARKHDMNANLLFAWRRLQSKGLLESQRHAPPLLPVRISSPTITPTQRAGARRRRIRVPRPEPPMGDAAGAVEIILASEVRVRFFGAASHKVLKQILEWLPRR